MNKKELYKEQGYVNHEANPLLEAIPPSAPDISLMNQQNIPVVEPFQVVMAEEFMMNLVIMETMININL